MNIHEPGTEPLLLLLNRDLMLGITVTNMSKALGMAVARVPSETALLQRWTDDRSRIALVVLDLNSPIDFAVITPLINDATGHAPVIGFGPHVDVQGRRAAKAAGLTRIFSNGEFHQKMGEILARYAGVSAGQAGPDDDQEFQAH